MQKHTTKWVAAYGLIAMELPDGFNDASKEMQEAVIENQSKGELKDAIREEFDKSRAGHRDFTKDTLANILVELRGEHRLAGAKPKTQPAEDTDD